jgi:hypothetical protein
MIAPPSLLAACPAQLPALAENASERASCLLASALAQQQQQQQRQQRAADIGCPRGAVRSRAVAMAYYTLVVLAVNDGY